jgi:biopolymer transport protein ExbD
MSWKIRHQGSPRSIEGLELPQVVEGLQDGLWETTDEVMGPQDQQWVAIESHPQLAEVVADLEPPTPKVEDDETRLDMNPLIDVALVLLIFFILTTSYAALQKVLNMPTGSTNDPKGRLVFTQKEIAESTIRVKVKLVNGKPAVYVEDEPNPVDEQSLIGVLSRFQNKSGRTNLFMDADENVDWGTVVRVQDAAKGAGYEKILHSNKPAPRG